MENHVFVFFSLLIILTTGILFKDSLPKGEGGGHVMIMTSFIIVFEHTSLHLLQKKFQNIGTPPLPSYSIGQPLLPFRATPILIQGTIVALVRVGVPSRRVGVALEEAMGGVLIFWQLF